MSQNRRLLRVVRKGSRSRSLLAGEVIHRDWILKQRIIARHHSNSTLSDKVALAVSLGVVADAGALRDVYVAVDDGLADAAVTPDIYVREKNAGIHFAVGIHAHVGRDHAIFHEATRDDAACGNDRIQRSAGAPGFGEYELRRRILPLMGADRPIRVIQIEDRGN